MIKTFWIVLVVLLFICLSILLYCDFTDKVDSQEERCIRREVEVLQRLEEIQHLVQKQRTAQTPSIHEVLEIERRLDEIEKLLTEIENDPSYYSSERDDVDGLKQHESRPHP